MRYHVLAFLCAAAVIAYVQRLGFNVAERTVRGDLGLEREQIGRVMAAWSLGYALLQLPSGWLADRFGSRRVLTALALAWSVLTGLVGLAWDFHSLLVLWFGMGLAQAGIFPCAAKSIGQWFGDSGRASAAGLLGSSMALGSAIAPALTGLLVAHHPWPLVFVAYAVMGIIWSAAYFAAVPDAPAGSGGRGVPVADHAVAARRCGVALFVPGEHYQTLQTSLRARFPGRPIVVVTLTGGWLPGYVPTAAAYGKGIYQESIALVAPGCAEALVEEIASRMGSETEQADG